MVEAVDKGALLIGALHAMMLPSMTASTIPGLTGPVVGAKGRRCGTYGMFWAHKISGLLLFRVGSGAAPRVPHVTMGPAHPNLPPGIECSSFTQ